MMLQNYNSYYLFKNLFLFYLQAGSDVLVGNQREKYSMETISTKTGIQSILIINQIVREDEGLYTCSMSNPFGSDAETLKVVVQGKCQKPYLFINFF